MWPRYCEESLPEVYLVLLGDYVQVFTKEPQDKGAWVPDQSLSGLLAGHCH